MVLHLLRKEILDRILGLRFLILAVLGSFLILLSLYDGVSYYRARVADDRAARSATTERIRNIKEAGEKLDASGWNWGESFDIGYLFSRPPQPLSIFVRGLSPFLGRSTQATAAGSADRRLTRSPAAEDYALLLSYPLDLQTAVQLIISLFIFLLTYDAVSGEKEAGTLRLLTSYPIRGIAFLVAKAFGALLPILAAFGLPALLGTAIVIALPDVEVTPPQVWRLALIGLTFVLYLSVCAFAGLLASALTRKPTTSLVLLLSFWVVSVAVTPRLGLVLADAVQAPPSVSEHEAEKRFAFMERYGNVLDGRQKYREEYQQRTGREVWDTPEGRETYYLYIRDVGREMFPAAIEERERIQEGFESRYDSWLDVGTTLASATPSFSLSSATIRLAGTGIDSHRRYRDLTNRYIDSYWAWCSTTFATHSLKAMNPLKYGEPKWDASDMPDFIYEETFPSEDVQAALINIGLLVAWASLFLSGASICMLGYDPR